MTDAIETFEVGERTVKLYHDDEPGSPREWDNLGHMVCWHRRLNLSDEQIRPEDHGNSFKELREWLEKERGAVVIPRSGTNQHWSRSHAGSACESNARSPRSGPA